MSGILSFSDRGIDVWDRLLRREKNVSGVPYYDHSFLLTPEREQLERYAEAFYGLARIFQQMPCQRERLGDLELEQIFGQVRRHICSSCEQYGNCWGKDFFRTNRNLYEIVNCWESGIDEETAEALLFETCSLFEEVKHCLQEAFLQARMELMWNNRMLEQRMAVGEQILQTAELLRKSSTGFSYVPEKEIRLNRQLGKELHYFGIELNGLRILSGENGHSDIYLLLQRTEETCISAKMVAEILSGCWEEPMRPAWNCQAAVNREIAGFHFVPETKYQLLCGISRITKAGELISGDNFSFLEKETGKVIMSLADGMGSGATACMESEKVIELLEQFLDAGFPKETAVRMINSCMLLQNCHQIYSTIDLCMVDLYEGSCDLIKFGAASTFLFRKDEIEVIDSDSFPAGVLQQSSYESMHRRLNSGDAIIMMTDGVLEALPEENREKTMVELIGKSAVRNAKEYARRLMEKVYFMQKLHAKDDMTILVGTIWEK